MAGRVPSPQPWGLRQATPNQNGAGFGLPPRSCGVQRCRTTVHTSPSGSSSRERRRADSSLQTQASSHQGMRLGAGTPPRSQRQLACSPQDRCIGAAFGGGLSWHSPVPVARPCFSPSPLACGRSRRQLPWPKATPTTRRRRRRSVMARTPVHRARAGGTTVAGEGAPALEAHAVRDWRLKRRRLA
jgi:hypothetical protein